MSENKKLTVKSIAEESYKCFMDETKMDIFDENKEIVILELQKYTQKLLEQIRDEILEQFETSNTYWTADVKQVFKNYE